METSMATRPPQYKGGSDNYIYSRDAASFIDAAFVFSKMPEGAEYWNDVILRLRAHSDANYTGKYPAILPSTVVAPAAGGVVSGLHGPTHVMHQGKACCNFHPGRPQDWPVGHQWVPMKDWQKSDCGECYDVASQISAKEAEEEENKKKPLK